jgi:arsenate reductase
MNTVIFACVHNAGRSQMAAAWFNALADTAKVRAVSAGTEPGARVHPEVLDAMREVGIDLSNLKPQRLTDDLARGAQMLVTMGCGEQCPIVPGLRRDDWPLEDPKGKPIERVRAIRDEVRARVSALLTREGWAAADFPHPVPSEPPSGPSAAEGGASLGRHVPSRDDRAAKPAERGPPPSASTDPTAASDPPDTRTRRPFSD